MTCWRCQNRRKFSRAAGVRATWLALCYPCWTRRQELINLAGRVALVLLGAAFAVGLVWAVAR